MNYINGSLLRRESSPSARQVEIVSFSELELTFPQMRELVDPTANLLYSGWTNWDDYEVLNMLENIWSSFIEPRIMAMCTECKKEYKWEKDGELIFGCGGLGLEAFGYQDDI